MDLFSQQVDRAVKSPNVAEWERIEKQLRANVNAAKRSGDAQELQWALSDYDKHYKKKQSYIEAGQQQVTIFDF